MNLNVLVAANAADAKKALAIAKSNAADAQPVAGLGEEAYWDKYLRTHGHAGSGRSNHEPRVASVRDVLRRCVLVSPDCVARICREWMGGCPATSTLRDHDGVCISDDSARAASLGPDGELDALPPTVRSVSIVSEWQIGFAVLMPFGIVLGAAIARGHNTTAVPRKVAGYRAQDLA